MATREHRVIRFADGLHILTLETNTVCQNPRAQTQRRDVSKNNELMPATVSESGSQVRGTVTTLSGSVDPPL
jgi:hypothetical protein